MAIIATKRFAQAAFDIAVEEGEIETWISDMNFIQDALSTEGLTEYFNSPRLPFSKKLELLDKIVDGKVKNSPRNMVALLIYRNTVDSLSTIIDQFKGLIDNRNHVSRGQIISAVPLNDKQLAELKTVLQGFIGNELVLSNTVDTSILGGIVARIGDKLIDASLRYKIGKMRSDLAR